MPSTALLALLLSGHKTRGSLAGGLHLAGLGGGRHECLPLRRLASLQRTKAAQPTEQAISLINRDGVLEFGARSVEQRFFAPSADDLRNGCVSVSFAFIVEGVAPDGNKRNADGAEDYECEKYRTKNDEEFFHARVLSLTRWS